MNSKGKSYFIYAETSDSFVLRKNDNGGERNLIF